MEDYLKKLAEAKVVKEKLRKRATDLSERIVSFQRLFADVAGRSAVSVFFEIFDSEGLSDTWLLAYENGELWVELFEDFDAEDYAEMPEATGEDGTRLTSTTLEVKAAAIQVFGDLIDKLINSDKSLLLEVERAHRAFEEAGLAVDPAAEGE